MLEALMPEYLDGEVEDIDTDFLHHVIDGLQDNQKNLSPKYFYDEQGSRYFDEICELDEYYPYRTELTLLPKVAKDIASRFFKPLSIVEFGAGSLLKIRPLLTHIQTVREFIPIDISGEHLHNACETLRQDYPGVAIKPKTGDFSTPVVLESFSGERIGFFPGSTIGNFTPEQARNFLSMARETLGASAYMLIGVDTKKSPDILHRAYNDSDGVTAKFNLNILHRINRELSGSINTTNFEHYAFYNASKGRIEMHLVSTKDQQFNVCGQSVEMRCGESIHTECSYKYTPNEFSDVARQAGWMTEQRWLAEDDMFSMLLLRAEA